MHSAENIADCETPTMRGSAADFEMKEKDMTIERTLRANCRYICSSVAGTRTLGESLLVSIYGVRRTKPVSVGIH